MGTFLEHSKSSAAKFGGLASDYVHIHRVMDSSKLFLADWRHRALLHNTYGIYLMEEHIIGPTFQRTSDGVTVDTRSVVSEHIKEDLAGVIPTPADFLREMPISYWMSGVPRSTREGFRLPTVTGSGRPKIIREVITWHAMPEDLPVEDGEYMVLVPEGQKPTFSTYSNGTFDRDVNYWSFLPIGP